MNAGAVAEKSAVAEKKEKPAAPDIEEEEKVIYPDLGQRKIEQVLFYENLLLEKAEYPVECNFEGYKKKYLCE